MKQIKDLKENEVILCKTQEECEAIAELLHKEGFTWRGGGSYIVNKYWEKSIGDRSIYFRPLAGIWGHQSDLEYRTIHNAQDFLPQQEKMKISLENYIRNKVDELECMHEYSAATDSIRAWIDVYNESSVNPVKQAITEIIQEWQDSRFQKSLISILNERLK